MDFQKNLPKKVPFWQRFAGVRAQPHTLLGKVWGGPGGIQDQNAGQSGWNQENVMDKVREERVPWGKGLGSYLQQGVELKNAAI